MPAMMPHLILTDLDDLIIKSNIAESSLKYIKNRTNCRYKKFHLKSLKQREKL